jgi:hypothetical protein
MALGISITAVLMLAWGHARTDTASADGPAMSLSVPDPVILDETFSLTINADPAPDVEISGFAAEVLFPAELVYSGSGDCQEEVPFDVGGLCLSLETSSGGRGISVLSSLASPPLPALDVAPGASGVALVAFDFTCTAAGDYKVTLTANPPAADGALYADVNAFRIEVKTETQDGGDVADTLMITCAEPPTPTLTNTPVPTATSPATATPVATVDDTVGPPVTGTGASGDAGAGLWMVIATLLAAAAVGLAVFGWRNLALAPAVSAAPGLAVFGWRYTRRNRKS